MKGCRRFAGSGALAALCLAVVIGGSCRPVTAPARPGERGAATGASGSSPAQPALPRAWPVVLGEENRIGARVSGGTVEGVRLEKAKALYGPDVPGHFSYQVTVRWRNDAAGPKSPLLFVTLWDFGQVCSHTVAVATPPEKPVPPGGTVTLGVRVRTNFAVAMVSFAEVEGTGEGGADGP